MHALLDQLFDIFKISHVGFGFAALVLFWIPIVVKKGGKLHNRIGWVYVVAMSGVAFTAVYMALWRLLLDENKTDTTIAFAWFLMFIAILSAVTAFFGIRTLRARRAKRSASTLEWFASGLLFLSSICISIYGIFKSDLLLGLFPLLTGAQIGYVQLNYWRKQKANYIESINAHFTGMLACSISTLTAFTVFGAPRLLGIENQNFLVWLAPSFVIAPIIIYFSRKYDVRKRGEKV